MYFINVDWVKWKSIWKTFFTVPSFLDYLSITCLSSVYKKRQQFTISSWTAIWVWEEVSLFNRVVSPGQVCFGTASTINTVQCRALWLPLENMSSAQEGNRMANLKKNVLDRYYKGNCGVALGYFESGKEWYTVLYSRDNSMASS